MNPGTAQAVIALIEISEKAISGRARDQETVELHDEQLLEYADVEGRHGRDQAQKFLDATGSN
jgi:hypothetical protein